MERGKRTLNVTVAKLMMFLMFLNVLTGMTIKVDAKSSAKNAVIVAKDSSIKVGYAFDKMENIKAVDNGGKGKDITELIEIEGEVNIEKVGKYTLTYSVTGENGSTVLKQVIITVEDRNKNAKNAVIDAKDITLKIGDSFDKMTNIKAVDDGGNGANLTKFIIVDGEINTKKAGKYSVTYKVTGENGIEIVKPIVITIVTSKSGLEDAIIEAENIVIKLKDKFDKLADVKAVDNGGNGKDLTKSLSIKGTVDTSKEGEYKLTYSVKGENGIKVSKDIIITVGDDISDNNTDGTDKTSKTNKTNKTSKTNKTDKTQKSDDLSFIKKVIELCNAERKKFKLRPLVEDSKLSIVAKMKSQDMINKDYFGHISPTYGDPFKMLRDNKVSFLYAGENLAEGQKTPERVVKEWMESPGHKANILNGNYTKIGVGYVKSKKGTTYWTQLFT